MGGVLGVYIYLSFSLIMCAIYVLGNQTSLIYVYGRYMYMEGMYMEDNNITYNFTTLK